MNNITIRVMTIEDYDGAYVLWAATEGVGLNDDDSRGAIERQLAHSEGCSFVAVARDGGIVGAVLGAHDGRRGTIRHLAVAKEARGAGVGGALVDAATAAMAARGIPKMWLVVFARNEGGNIFWEKMGFAPRDDLVYRNRSIL